MTYGMEKDDDHKGKSHSREVRFVRCRYRAYILRSDPAELFDGIVEESARMYNPSNIVLYNDDQKYLSRVKMSFEIGPFRYNMEPVNIPSANIRNIPVPKYAKNVQITIDFPGWLTTTTFRIGIDDLARPVTCIAFDSTRFLPVDCGDLRQWVVESGKF